MDWQAIASIGTMRGLSSSQRKKARFQERPARWGWRSPLSGDRSPPSKQNWASRGSTRRDALELTATGLELQDHVRGMMDAATRVSLTATGPGLAIDGPVCITASELIAAYVLPPVVARIRQRHPGIEIEIVASNNVADLRRREADIAVRNVSPSQPELLAEPAHT